VDGRPWADHRLLPAEVEDAFPLDYIDDLVVDMAVIGCAARRDRSHELRQVEAADILVHEVSELAVLTGAKHRPVGVADGPASRVDGRPDFERRFDDDDDQLFRTGVLELVLLPLDDIRAHVGLERMFSARDVKRPSTRLDVEELLRGFEPSRPGPARPAADHPLGEALRPVTAIDRDRYVHLHGAILALSRIGFRCHRRSESGSCS
jgi:hypothetical protein